MTKKPRPRSTANASVSPSSKSAGEARTGSPARSIEQIAREISAREKPVIEARERARVEASFVHQKIETGLARFHATVESEGVPHLRVDLGPVEPDDKSVQAWQIRLRRGRWEGVVISKARGEVTFVGPFKRGGTEGPCRRCPSERKDEIEAVLGEFSLTVS